MKKILFFAAFTFCVQFSHSQVGIGTSNPQGAFEVVNTTDGMLISRVALVNTTTATILTPTKSEMAYNTATAGDVTPGYYYWETTPTVATDRWIRLANSSNDDWKKTGNAGTTPGTNFIGTTDAQDLRFKTGGTDRLNVSNTSGQLQTYTLGSATDPSYSFQTDSNSGIYSAAADNINITTGGTERVRIDANGNVGINKTATEKLDVNGNVRLSGALMPNNISGTTGKALLSAGAGVAPTWTPYTYTNLGNTLEISKYFSTISTPNGGSGNWPNNTVRAFVITGPVTVNSTLFINFIGPYVASNAGLIIQSVTSETGQIRVAVLNTSGATIPGGLSIPITIAGFF